MAREAKHALIFVAILGLVFGGLLWKRLRSPAGSGLNLFAQTDKKAEAPPPVRPTLPVQPTLVTPRGDNDRPPELAVGGGQFDSNSYRSGRYDDSSRQPASSWNSMPQRYADSGSSKTNSGTPTSQSPQSDTPSLLTARTPVADVASTPVPHRSSYPIAVEDKPATPLPVTTTPVEIPANPIPKATADANLPSDAGSRTDTSRSQIDSMPQRLDPIPSRYDTQPTAGIAAKPSITSQSTPYSQGTPYSQKMPIAGGQSSLGSNNGANNLLAANPAAASSGSFSNPSPIYGNRNPIDTPTSSNSMPSTGTAWPAQPTPASRYNTAAVPTTTGVYGDTSSSMPPPQRDGDQYTVGPNDSFWTISQKTYGTGAFFKALYELNRKRMKDPNDLKVGQVLSVPDENTLRRLYPDLCPKPRKPAATTGQRMISASAHMGGTGRVYTVADGDTLFEIARHELGKPSRWAEIYQLNHDILGDDFDYLRPGTELILPADAATPSSPRGGTAIRQPQPLYPR